MSKRNHPAHLAARTIRKYDRWMENANFDCRFPSRPMSKLNFETGFEHLAPQFVSIAARKFSFEKV